MSRQVPHSQANTIVAHDAHLQFATATAVEGSLFGRRFVTWTIAPLSLLRETRCESRGVEHPYMILLSAIAAIQTHDDQPAQKES